MLTHGCCSYSHEPGWDTNALVKCAHSFLRSSSSNVLLLLSVVGLLLSGLDGPASLTHYGTYLSNLDEELYGYG